MTAPALPTFTDGLVVHQADLNALVSNINVLAANTSGKLQAAQYLRPLTTVKTTANQNVTTGTTTLVSWGSASINTDNMWTGSAPTQMTVQTAGVYFLTMFCLFNNGLTTSNNSSEARIMVNGTSPSANTVACETSSIYNGGWFVAANCVVSLAAGATIYFAVAQASGSTGVLGTGFGGCQASAVFLSK